ncbi:hypothetical protein RJT34_08465 [Clitoria ternatea]|uniref:Uncharacterized protein n=1 Tax=Clitoria ternatea TaxID=43366 RepID=A0AAN9K5U0_CLITE
MENTKHNKSYTNDVFYEGAINVPFSWEHKPGLPKEVTHGHNGTRHGTKLVLQPPPCGSGRDHKQRVEDTQIPLSLCAVQSSLRISSFRMESQKELEDPFVEAYKKCTKSPFILRRYSNKRGEKNNGSWPTIRKYMHILSCKQSGDVSL